MPSILGLTNDPSPHGPSSSAVSTQVQSKASGSLTGGASSSNDSNQSSSKSGGVYKGFMGGGKNSTISSRNKAAAIEVETLLWRAMCDSPKAALEYIADDAVIINPFFAHTDAPLTKDSDPSLEKALGGAKPFGSFKMHEGAKVVEIDLMAVAVLYRLTLFKMPGGGGWGGDNDNSNKKASKGTAQTYEATVSSCWRQLAGGDWRLCSQHVAYADIEED